MTAQTRDRTIGSKDVNEVLPFDLEAVTTALTPALAAMGAMEQFNYLGELSVSASADTPPERA